MTTWNEIRAEAAAYDAKWSATAPILVAAGAKREVARVFAMIRRRDEYIHRADVAERAGHRLRAAIWAGLAWLEISRINSKVHATISTAAERRKHT